MSTIEKQLAFLSSQAFREYSNEKSRKQLKKVFETLRKYLPADKRSLWPKELRKKTVPGWLSTTVVAFSGTMGASATFAPAVKPFLKEIKPWTGGLDKTRSCIFEAIIYNRFLQGNNKNRYFEAVNLMTILSVNTAWPVISYDGMDYAVSGEDLRRLIAEMKAYNSRARLAKISQIDEWYGTFYVLTFVLDAGISFHLITAPTLCNQSKKKPPVSSYD